MKKTYCKDEISTILCVRNENGELHGLHKQYFERYKKYSVGVYKNDICYGVYQRWFYDGTIHWMDTNKNKSINGIEIVFKY